MKKYKISSYITEADIAEVEKNIIDKDVRDAHLDEILSNLLAKRAYSNSGIPYKDVLLFKEAFRIGFAAAHIDKVIG